ncbi:50S ribosome-binding GTPase [Candidatus Woesearchaeota archaeon]|nr:50S ribosome-binding GTPase [Candidatus Woesearchaeota archaeon]
MNFQTLTKVESAQFYLDTAFRNGQQAAVRFKLQNKPSRDKPRLDRTKNMEYARVTAIKNSMVSSLSTILKSFPDISSLPTFYYELVKVTLDYYSLKKSLGTMNWGRAKVEEFYRQYIPKIRSARDFRQMEEFRKQFFGRVSSIFYQMDKAFKYLESARKTMKEYPTVKTETKTVVLAGFPNVGKTTLLFRLTGSRPEIANYAFTTKRINISYFREGDERIQVLDTPGTLNRFNKMNMVEKQAYLAMKHCADAFVYVIDPTEPYPIKDQEKLLKMVRGFKKQVIVYVSKTDIVESPIAQAAVSKYRAVAEAEILKKEIMGALGASLKSP